MLRILSFIFILLTGCTFQPGRQEMVSESESHEILSREVEATSMMLFIEGTGEVLLEFDAERLTVDIYNTGDLDNPVQTLGPFDSEIDFSDESFSMHPEFIFNPDDLNFDGYLDLKIIVSEGEAGNWYRVFLYDPAKKQFSPHKELSRLVSLSCDTSRKIITSLSLGGIPGTIYTFDTYRWKGKKLVLLQTEKQDGTFESPDIFVRTVYRTGKDGLTDTLAVARIMKKAVNEWWCLEKGDWQALENSPFPGENVVRTDGRESGCF